MKRFKCGYCGSKKNTANKKEIKCKCGAIYARATLDSNFKSIHAGTKSGK